VECPTDLLIPVLPSRKNGKLMFDLESPKTGAWSTHELRMAVARGYRITHCEWVLHFPEWSQRLFRGYIQTFFLLKTLAGGFKGNEAEAKVYLQEHLRHLHLTYESPEVERVLSAFSTVGAGTVEERLLRCLKLNPTLKTVAKLLLNTLYGKFGEVPHMKVVHADSHEEFYNLVTNPAYHIMNIRMIHERSAEVTYAELLADTQSGTDKSTVCVPIAAMVTAYARCRLIEEMERVGPERVLYVDTDSIYYVTQPGQHSIPTGHMLGDMEDDLKGGRLVQFFASTAPKAYGCYVQDSKGKVSPKVRYKGVPATMGNEHVLSPLALRRAWQEESFEQQAVMLNFRKDRHTHAVTTRTMQRTVRNTFSKREPVRHSATHIDSRPWGFQV
jgi:hypothetical protein